jgi:8-hydroxy-5-deazaflavin:NADPH oxidoreductase
MVNAGNTVRIPTDGRSVGRATSGSGDLAYDEGRVFTSLFPEEGFMRIAVIGTGNVGSTLGRGWVKAGHEVIFGSRQPQSQKVQGMLKELGPHACAEVAGEAVKGADAVLLAVPWSAAQATLRETGDLAGKVLIDTMNPLGPNGLMVGFDTSAAESVAGWAKGAHVVKAFNTTGSGNMANTDYGREKPTMFICGDNAAAKKVVARLAEDVGFEPVDAGPLKVARYLEPLTALWVQLAYVQKLGPNIAFKLLRR